MRVDGSPEAAVVMVFGALICAAAHVWFRIEPREGTRADPPVTARHPRLAIAWLVLAFLVPIAVLAAWVGLASVLLTSATVVASVTLVAVGDATELTAPRAYRLVLGAMLVPLAVCSIQAIRVYADTPSPMVFGVSVALEVATAYALGKPTTRRAILVGIGAALFPILALLEPRFIGDRHAGITLAAYATLATCVLGMLVCAAGCALFRPGDGSQLPAARIR